MHRDEEASGDYPLEGGSQESHPGQAGVEQAVKDGDEDEDEDGVGHLHLVRQDLLAKRVAVHSHCLNCPARPLLIVEGPVHGIQEEKFSNTVDRFAVIDSFLVISAHSNVQPVLVLCLVLPSCEGVLEITLIILSLIN